MKIFHILLRILKCFKFVIGAIVVYVIIVTKVKNSCDIADTNLLPLKEVKEITEKKTFGAFAETKNIQKLAYGFFAVTKVHIIAALVNIRRLKEKREAMEREPKKVDFLILTNIEPREGTIMTPDIKRLKYRKLPSRTGYYHECMVKLLFFNMTDYYRIIFMDIDAIVLKPLDELFDLPSSVSLASPVAYWENELCFTGALLVIKPDRKTWLQLFNRMEGMVKNRRSEMDLINEFYDRRITSSFKIYPETILLPGYFLILSSHLREKGQSYYKEFATIFQDIDKLVNKTYIVHFSGQQKPWDLSRQSIMSYKSISKHFYDFNLVFKDEYEAILKFLETNKTTNGISLRGLFDYT